MLSDVASKYKIPKNKLIFIPQTTFQTIPKVKVNSACFTILFAGGQNLLKGSRQMKIVAGYLKSSVYTFRLKWCLDAGNMKAGFEDDVRFEFLGDLPREDFYRVLQSSDCIIIPTRMDTGPLLVVEAMSYGVIPICNNLSESAIVDLVEHLKNGILVDNNNPKSFYEFLVLLMNNKEVKQDLKKNALKFFSKNLTPTKQLERFEALFENKKFFKKEDSFSGINVIYYHLKKTNHLPRYSFKRIRSKLTNALEIPMYKNRT
jgi:glycosyltransferase involved in cell wall biosynthesis